MKRTGIATQVLELGRGYKTEVIDGKKHYSLVGDGLARADATGRHFVKHKDLFVARRGKIVVSGKYGKVASRGLAEEPPEGVSEASLTCDYLMDEYDIEAEYLEAENESVSTVDNFAKVVAGEYFADQEFSPENPLGLTGGPQKMRAGPLTRAALSVLDNAIQWIGSGKEWLNPVTDLREAVGAMATRLAISEVATRYEIESPFNVPQLQQVGAEFNYYTDHPLELAVVSLLAILPSRR